ncbi:MAG: hypothetical protein K9M45_09395 [Kiritimatiellales bacterium]|nr:hypothetical protein [Kiritimatiellales bacterium]
METIVFFLKIVRLMRMMYHRKVLQSILYRCIPRNRECKFAIGDGMHSRNHGLSILPEIFE